MTVAAIVLAPDLATALSDADGEPAIRRIVHSAWAGGALPIVIVARDLPPELIAAVAGMPASCQQSNSEPGIAWFCQGFLEARSKVTETTAALLWPAKQAWVDPETVTSLVEAHGQSPDEILRPCFDHQQGMPVLIPASFEDALAALTGQGLHGGPAVAALVAGGATQRELDLGDPGIVFDLATPRSEMPGYEAPSRP
jgi:CTP:molybdopterin cytidylyltransferase MocA